MNGAKQLRITVTSIVGWYIRRVFFWWLRRSWLQWTTEWQHPANKQHRLLIVFQPFILVAMAWYAFSEGLLVGFSFLGWYFWAASNAIVIRGPLGIAAPVAIFVGVIFAGAIRPLFLDAKTAAFQGQLLQAAAILVMAIFSSRVTGRLQRGEIDWHERMVAAKDEPANVLDSDD